MLYYSDLCCIESNISTGFNRCMSITMNSKNAMFFAIIFSVCLPEVKNLLIFISVQYLYVLHIFFVFLFIYFLHFFIVN